MNVGEFEVMGTMKIKQTKNKQTKRNPQKSRCYDVQRGRNVDG